VNLDFIGSGAMGLDLSLYFVAICYFNQANLYPAWTSLPSDNRAGLLHDRRRSDRKASSVKVSKVSSPLSFFAKLKS
jgi:hypothetical protein